MCSKGMKQYLCTRRQFCALAPAAAFAESRIGRRALVARHSPANRSADPRSPLSVGNSEFGFTADFTGLQSLPSLCERGIPLCTQSQWGWHSFPIPPGLNPAQLRLEMFDTYGRQAGNATSPRGQEPLYNWLRENPHRLNLARLGLLLDGQPLKPEQISGVDQKLDLWSGLLRSVFTLNAAPVEVLTACHPVEDTWLANRHNPQRAGLPLYLPGNGGLLAAAALMAAGWQGASSDAAPGFPPSWRVRPEGLRPML
jgi:hypothetical protein